jgi:hypothetical protein
MELRIEGKLPKGVLPTIIRVEPEKGTFAIYSGDTWLANGQFVK